MKLKIGISPCPNDTFIFDAIINKKIDLQGLEFEFILADVEELNKSVINNQFDISKISYYLYSKIMKDYIMLNSGGALGTNCGPILISKNADITITEHQSVAIPGIHTTANYLLSRAFPQLNQKDEVLFSDIETTVLEGKKDLGLIIHESRFTYESKGLKKVVDLGEYWESETHSPLPLGGIVAQRNLPRDILYVVDDLISQSVAYAFAHPEDSKGFIKLHAQEMNDDVIAAHINLYVNEYSLRLGDKGKQAVHKLLNELYEKGHITFLHEELILS
jgi:1,4-dihydroxy-6-naphthoate synthase